MSKKAYSAPMLLGPINPEPTEVVPYGPSQGQYNDDGDITDLMPDSETEETP